MSLKMMLDGFEEVIKDQNVCGVSVLAGNESFAKIKEMYPAPESDSVLVVYMKHTRPVCERTRLDPWLGCSFPLQRGSVTGN